MEVEEEQRKALEDVFGDSSSSEGEGECEWEWEAIDSVKGLWVCRNFLSPHLQTALLSSIHNQGWFTQQSHNQAMRFGDLPPWALNLSDQIYEAVSTVGEETLILPSHLLHRHPLFDQLIINKYLSTEGICAHVDLMRFEDGIAIVSLESPCVMHFSPLETDGTEAMKVPVYLASGSLVVMSGDARYKWKHEINRKPGFQVWQGQHILQSGRTSVTLRKLCITM